jgi:hypothetical protein
MIITPRVYVHRRLNQAQKAVLAGNYKLAVVITRWVLIKHMDSARRPLFQNDFCQFMKDHKAFGEWVSSNEGLVFISTREAKRPLLPKGQARVVPTRPYEYGMDERVGDARP